MQKCLFALIIFVHCSFSFAKEKEKSLDGKDLSVELSEEIILPPKEPEGVDEFELLLKKKDIKPPLEPEGEEETFASLIEFLEEEQSIIQEEERKKREESSDFTDKMKDFHTSVSEDVVSIANAIDSFFVNKNILDNRNRTNIRLANTSSWIESRGLDNDFDFRLRLRLPHLKRKIQIEFEDDSLNEDTISSRDNLSITQNTRRQGGSRGGLSLYQQLKGIDTKLSSGVQIDHGLVAWGKFRISKDFVINSRQKFTFIHDVFDDTNHDLGQQIISYYDYSINKFVLLRFANEEMYRDIGHVFTSTHGLSLYQQLTDRNFLSYNYRLDALNPSTSHSYYLNSHLVSVNFRHRLFRQHLYMEIGPGMLFPKAEGFEGLWTFTFRLELIFGNV